MQPVGELVRLGAQRLGGLPRDAQLLFSGGSSVRSRMVVTEPTVRPRDGDRLAVEREDPLADEHDGVAAGRRRR